MTLTLGIDDAGRGPLIGSMFISAVLLDESSKSALTGIGIKDSKQVLHSTRIKLAELIKSRSLGHKVVEISPLEIDNALRSEDLNLNTLEAIKMAEAINSLNNNKDKIKVIIDCPSVNTKAFSKTLESYIDHPQNLILICEHKADANHLEAAAASILSKVARESLMEKIKKQYGNTGSGYPSDPYTKSFLTSNGEKLKDSGIFRKTWATWKKIFPEDSPQIINSKKQKSLSDF